MRPTVEKHRMPRAPILDSSDAQMLDQSLQLLSDHLVGTASVAEVDCEVKNLRSICGHGGVRMGRDDDEADQRVGPDLQSYLSGAVCPHRRLPQVFMACKILTTVITSKNGYSFAR